MRIAICDDQIEFRSQTESVVRECLRGMDYAVNTFKDGVSFLQDFKKRQYDLVILDIEMPTMDGITLAKKIREISGDILIVFLTSHIEYALEGYEVNALRYLVKPLDINKMRGIISYVAERLRQQKVLWIKTDLCDQKVPVKDILYMEAQNQNVQICTAKEKYSVRYNLGDYEKELSEDGFFRIHRGFLVSLRHIKSIGKNEVALDDYTVLPVSRSNEKPLKEALFQYIRTEAI